jgi:hypothetical protein
MSDDPPPPRWHVGDDVKRLLLVIALGPGAVLVMLAIGWFQRIELINALPVHVRVEIDGRTEVVAAGGVARLRVRPGPQTLRAFTGSGEYARPIEERTLVVRRVPQSATYNLLSAQTLFFPGARDGPAETYIQTAPPELPLEAADHPFRHDASVAGPQDWYERRHLPLFGVRNTLGFLHGVGDTREMRRLIGRLRAAASVETPELLTMQRAVTGPTGWVLAAREADSAGDPAGPLLYLRALLAVGRRDEARRHPLFDTTAAAPGSAGEVVDQAEALLRAGQRDAAAQQVLAALRRKPDQPAPALLARQLERDGALGPLEVAMNVEVLDWTRSLLGEPRQRGRAFALTEAADVQQEALSSPEAGRLACARSNGVTLTQLHPTVAVLLVAEAERIGDHALSARLRRLAIPALDVEAVRAFVLHGEEQPELRRLSPAARGAMDFVRARVLIEPPDADFDASVLRRRDANALVAAARAAEVPRGPLHVAIASWPEPGESQPRAVTLARDPAAH